MIIRCRLTGIILFILCLFTLNKAIGQANLGKLKCICIDAGHGGKDPGAPGLKSYEKDIVLSIALKVGSMVKEKYPDVKVVYTRDKDVFIELDKRGKIANDNKAELFISIHINSNKSKIPQGLETYVLGLHRSKENLEVAMKENSVIEYEKDYSVKYAGFDPGRVESYIIFSVLQNLYLENSLQLAGLVQEEMVGNTRRQDRGVRQAGYLVLKDAAMPAILIEAGFISNAEEERYLNTAAGQRSVANSIFKAISRYKANVERNSRLLTDESELNDVAEVENVKELPEKTTTAGRKPFYAIQVASAAAKIKNSSGLCHGEEVCELKSGGRFRYYVAESESIEQVKKTLQKIKDKVRDCFIIAIHQGEVISLPEAKKILERK